MYSWCDVFKLEFQIDSLDSVTNQLSLILGATRMDLDKVNETVANITIEVTLY